MKAGKPINVGGSTSSAIRAGSMVARVIGDGRDSVPVIPVFANMLHTGESVEAEALTGGNWQLLALTSIVDIANSTSLVKVNDGEFENQTGRALKLKFDFQITYSPLSTLEAHEFSVGINNGSGYATNSDDLYNDEMRMRRGSFDSTNAKGVGFSQTVFISAGDKFGVLVRNSDGNGTDINCFYVSLQVREVA